MSGGSFRKSTLSGLILSVFWSVEASVSGFIIATKDSCFITVFWLILILALDGFFGLLLAPTLFTGFGAVFLFSSFSSWMFSDSGSSFLSVPGPLSALASSVLSIVPFGSLLLVAGSLVSASGALASD